MAKWVALLRGINVTGHRRVTMKELASALESRRLENVRTYKASGNVIFDSASKAASLTQTIASAIEDTFGLDDVGVLVLSGVEMRTVSRANPLLGRPGIDPGFLGATFTFGKVAKAAFANLELPITGDEQAVLAGQAVYFYCPHGYGRTKITNGWFEKALGVPCTSRNWRTVTALVEMVG